MIRFILVETEFPLREKTNQIKFVVHAATSTTAISSATQIVANYSSDLNRISKVIPIILSESNSDIIILLL